MDTSTSFHVTSDRPLPLCIYHQVAWMGTPTKFTKFAVAQIGANKTHVTLAIQFKETIPAFVEQYKNPQSFCGNYGEEFITQYGEDLHIQGQIEQPICFLDNLTQDDIDILMPNGQFPTVTELKQSIYGMDGNIKQKEALSSEERRLFDTIREAFNKKFPNLANIGMPLY